VKRGGGKREGRGRRMLGDEAVGRGGGWGWDKEKEGKGKGGKEGSTPPVFSKTPSLNYLEISLR
jgi:hypothetical protein